MKLIGALFVLAALVLPLAGLLSLSKATLGVGLIACGAVAAIFARLCQAETQHKELKRMLNSPDTTKS